MACETALVTVQKPFFHFCPYPETMHYEYLEPHSTWSLLLPSKSAAQTVPGIALVSEMSRNTDAADFITTLLPHATRTAEPTPP
ncbi:hypothetical protein D9758_016784 [Tetrapyrgos nigripes]|uniref:Uncharacterized protein n=1 Tax=Tetrapyrgos nigripes TaxID=182062 RepID=A0A8H5BRM1_9AGAR|nr:hypothetical protein D9758_016784 [Tetrapyrgos nigripes]